MSRSSVIFSPRLLTRRWELAARGERQWQTTPSVSVSSCHYRCSTSSNNRAGVRAPLKKTTAAAAAASRVGRAGLSVCDHLTAGGWFSPPPPPASPLMTGDYWDEGVTDTVSHKLTRLCLCARGSIQHILNCNSRTDCLSISAKSTQSFLL